MSLITEQVQPVAATGKSVPRTRQTTSKAPVDTSIFMINPIHETEGIVVASTNINALGRSLYYDRSATIQTYATLRMAVPGLALAMYFIGGRVVKSLLLKQATTAALGAAKTAGKLPISAKFAAAAQWAASKIHRAEGITQKAGLIGKAVSWGSTAIAVTCSMSDILSWYYDAMTDFAASHHFMFTDAYTRADQLRLNALLKAGREAKTTKKSYYARVTLTPKQVKGFLMLSSEIVVDQPFDVEVAMPVAAAWTTYASSENNRTQQARTELVATMYVADPDDTSEKGAANALAEAKVLLMRLTRALEQFADADYENLLVPVILFATRLSCVPGVISKVAPGFIAPADAILSTSFDAETDVIQDQILESDYTQHSSWIDAAADFLNNIFNSLGGINNGTAE